MGSVPPAGVYMEYTEKQNEIAFHYPFSYNAVKPFANLQV